MRLVKPYAEIISSTQNAEILVEYAGRVCYKSEDKITNGSYEKFIRARISQGHESVIEHASASVRIVCDRGVSHELVRQRLASYSQESTRYCDYSEDDLTFVIPPWINLDPGRYSLGCGTIYYEGIPFVPDDVVETWLNYLNYTSDMYKELINYSRWTPQMARSVLPHALKTEVIMTANFREWRHIFKARCAKQAHPQMQELMIPLRTEFIHRWPVFFGDLDENN